MSTLVKDFTEALLAVDKSAAEGVLVRAQAMGVSAGDFESIVVEALETIGKDWETGEAALSQVYMSGRICEELMASAITQNEAAVKIPGRCAIAVLNDHHMLGKRIVLSALRLAGFDIDDWGCMDSDSLAAQAVNQELDAVLVSTLMLPSALAVKDLKTRLQELGFRGKLLVGGAPFRLDKQLWKEVGADATADNAMESIQALTTLLGGRP